MTNFGTRAILALPKMPERRLRFLLALETFTRREDDWREAGTALLASTAGLSVKTTARARVELVKSGDIEYRRGNGRGQVGTYRIKVVINDVHLPEPEKVPSDTDHLSSPGKVPSDTDHLSEPGKVVKQPRKGGQTAPGKVTIVDSVTSTNAFGALEPSALEPSALEKSSRRTPRTGSRGRAAATDDLDFALRTTSDPREMLARLGATADQIEPAHRLLASLTVDVIGYLRAKSGDPEAFMRWLTRQLAEPDAEAGP